MVASLVVVITGAFVVQDVVAGPDDRDLGPVVENTHEPAPEPTPTPSETPSASPEPAPEPEPAQTNHPVAPAPPVDVEYDDDWDDDDWDDDDWDDDDDDDVWDDDDWDDDDDD